MITEAAYNAARADCRTSRWYRAVVPTTHKADDAIARQIKHRQGLAGRVVRRAAKSPAARDSKYQSFIQSLGDVGARQCLENHCAPVEDRRERAREASDQLAIDKRGVSYG